MTGSLAVVMASVCNVGGAAPADRRTQVRQSPYDVSETTRRLEQAAQAKGLQVLASVAPPAPGPVPERFVVLASSEGGTPVMMDGTSAPPDMPMTLHVRATRDGGAEVLLTEVDIDLGDVDSEWPSTLAGELSELPKLIERALR